LSALHGAVLALPALLPNGRGRRKAAEVLVPGAQTLEPGQCGAPVLIRIDEPVDDFDALATA
jgi:hypothetical protein